MATNNSKVVGYLPNDSPPLLQIILLGFQHVLTMFPATVLVAALCGFHIGTVLTISGLGTIVALLLAKWRIGKFIPLFYGSSFSYIAAYLAIAQPLHRPRQQLKYRGRVTPRRWWLAQGQPHQRHKMAHMQAVRRRVKAIVQGDLTPAQLILGPFRMVKQQPAPFQFCENILAHVLTTFFCHGLSRISHGFF